LFGHPGQTIQSQFYLMSDTTLSWPYKGFQIVDSRELDYLL
jgi:hypothetical protein